MSNYPAKIVLSTAYLPPIEYFAYIVNAEEVFIELFETYPKQTYRNRCKIYTANGVLSLSIPVKNVSGNSTITKDIQISSLDNWQKNHWRAIESAYSASPYFMYFKDELEGFYTQSFESLVQFNTELLKQIFDFISFSTEISFTDDYAIESFKCPKYYQVFDEKFGFQPNLSIIDLLFSEGPNTLSFLKEIVPSI